MCEREKSERDREKIVGETERGRQRDGERDGDRETDRETERGRQRDSSRERRENWREGIKTYLHGLIGASSSHSGDFLL